jgi:kynurenine formamidase
MTTVERHLPSEEQVLGYIDQLSNWGRWGVDDERGTLNLITDDVRRRAAALVLEGTSMSLALDLTTQAPHQGVFQRFMILNGQGLDEPERVPTIFARSRTSAHTEWVSFAFHGPFVTHLDAPSHVSWDRRLYNGAAAASVSSFHGATRSAVTALRDGIFTRGVLLDVPRLRGVDWLEASEGVFPEDLEAAEAAHGFTVGPGDAVLLRTGYQRRVAEVGPIEHLRKPGWHAACTPWFHERQVAVIGSDVACDVGPSGYAGIGIPVHVIALRAMGMPILDELDLERVGDEAERLGRREFLLTAAPLRLQGGTGSPLNPVATF